eukprot:5717233-Amphidinium_carterae.6
MMSKSLGSLIHSSCLNGFVGCTSSVDTPTVNQVVQDLQHATPQKDRQKQTEGIMNLMQISHQVHYSKGQKQTNERNPQSNKSLYARVTMHHIFQSNPYRESQHESED